MGGGVGEYVERGHDETQGASFTGDGGEPGDAAAGGFVGGDLWRGTDDPEFDIGPLLADLFTALYHVAAFGVEVQGYEADAFGEAWVCMWLGEERVWMGTTATRSGVE